MSTRILVSTAAAVLLAASVVAQTTPPAAPEQPAVQVAGAEPAAHGTATRDKDTLSVDFPDEDIKTILRNVADLFELNLVVPDTLVGKTSIKLRDVTWRQIFQVVLTPAGYTYVEEGNIIKVMSAEQLGAEPVATEVFILNNAKAQDIKPTVDGLVDSAAGGKILIDARSNALVVTERPSRMTRIRTIIEQLDKATAQVMIESKFVEVSDSDIRNIGVNWASLSGTRIGVGNIRQQWERGSGRDSTNDITNSIRNETLTSNQTNNSNTTSVTNGSFTNASTLVTSDNSTTRVLPTTGQSTTTSTSTLPGGSNGTGTTTVANSINFGGTTNSNQSGTSSETENIVGSEILGGLSNAASNAVNQLIGLTAGNTQSRLASAVFSASDFNIILSALKSQNNTKVISNPTIVTLNNAEAMINIGREFPIPSYTYNSERGTFEVSGFQYKPIGVILKVVPQVNAQGTIRLALEPEISQQSDSTTFGGAGGASIPIIDTRKVKTQVSLKDGYTAGIGGLISVSKSNGGTKVPVLGSIPVLGRLFSSKSVTDRTTNLLIFITAKTVNPDGAAPSDVFNAEALQSIGMGGPGTK